MALYLALAITGGMTSHVIPARLSILTKTYSDVDGELEVLSNYRQVVGEYSTLRARECQSNSKNENITFIQRGSIDETKPLRFVNMEKKLNEMIPFRFVDILSKRNETVNAETAQTHR
ncbi:unnamed protein product [Ceratitis capitata]|uniref:(Mediterranean fruit fly) hypothetical protein n=1 Tax=Ceratitis capitata TaxID=7213 RepID=A0A811UD99_CERCA|nr:unnamed protein product [Ceratitis capitata]